MSAAYHFQVHSWFACLSLSSMLSLHFGSEARLDQIDLPVSYVCHENAGFVDYDTLNCQAPNLMPLHFA